ncbi:MAG: agmatinase [Hyphomicrobiaceae bacterium]|nr:agmatinase [Hyphomicrobiaceae bacterium]
MSAKLSYLPGKDSFLDPLRADADDPASAKAVVIPFGLEASVSYGGGTRAGPQAILAASQQLELYDPEFGREVYAEYGIAALTPPAVAKPLTTALAQLEGLVGAVLDLGKFPFVLGGEHSLTAGAIRPFAQRFKDLVVLQLDAHADLRDGYQGEHFSHASAMRRVLDNPGVSLISVGIRAVSSPEVAFYEANRDRIRIFWGHEQARWNLEEIVAPLAGRPVYITFDIDALDGSVMPATGTPTPEGLSFPLALEIVRRACAAAGQVVGADLVEFAPIPQFHAYDFTAALLAYKMLSYALAKGVHR